MSRAGPSPCWNKLSRITWKKKHGFKSEVWSLKIKKDMHFAERHMPLFFNWNFQRGNEIFTRQWGLLSQEVISYFSFLPILVFLVFFSLASPPPAPCSCVQSALNSVAIIFLFYKHWAFLKIGKVCRLNIFKFLYFKNVYFNFIYLFLERGEGKEEERERKINVWLPPMRPLLGTWPTAQACALTGNRTDGPLVHSPALHPLSYTSQGYVFKIF